ncbi:MAG: DUF4127 family protein [Candidatus Gastranaerophilales bacterium]|nr:DUF4127 family protein [Candidatus Gastranaerophilales bacterium]
MHTIAFIPIDNRPVCMQLPQQIAALDKNIKIMVPPLNCMGDLKNSAHINNILKWIESLENIDTAIISLDTAAYGGLITSRKCNDDISMIKTRIEKLISVLLKTKARIFAFSSIMRISNNNINEEEKEYWNKYGTKIFEYSYNCHKTGIPPKTDIPNEILQDYLNTRKRNFDINKYYLELAKQGIFDCLVFSKDDCSKFGLNVKEAKELEISASSLNNVFIKTGADEIPLTLLSRAINYEKNIKIAPIYTAPESIHKISKYEDISVEESVKSQIELAGAKVSTVNDSDMILIVNNFENEQGELVMNVHVPLFNSDLILPEKPYCIADILNANGSDNNFAAAFLKKNNLKNFYGYAAWNTTGNTLGCVISTALTYYKAQKPDKTAFKILNLTRFLDDWAYQANIREKIKHNTNNLSGIVLKNEMKNYENILLNKFGVKAAGINYSFPWNRFFEIKIDIEF